MEWLARLDGLFTRLTTNGPQCWTIEAVRRDTDWIAVRECASCAFSLLYAAVENPRSRIACSTTHGVEDGAIGDSIFGSTPLCNSAVAPEQCSVRYLSIDLGDKRTGLAVGDSITRTVMPLDVVEVARSIRDGEALVEALAKAVKEQLGEAGPGELVVGLPYNMDGTEGPRARIVRALAARIAERAGRAVHFQDERLTSDAADWAMARSGLTRGKKKELRDALAAAAILRDYLEGLAGG